MLMLIRVRTFPGARKERFVEMPPKEHSNILDNVRMFEAYVREPAQKNLANTRVRELVAEHFGSTLSRVIIKKGHRSRSKVIEII